MCSDDFPLALSKERRIDLPSMATTPSQASAIPALADMQAELRQRLAYSPVVREERLSRPPRLVSALVKVIVFAGFAGFTP